jgi:predicted nucleic acid-binding protein
MNGHLPFVDTNVVVYAFDEAAGGRTRQARALVDQGAIISVQTLNEFAAVARRKLGFSWPETLDALAAIRALSPVVIPLTVAVHERALAVAQRYGYHLWDALIIAAALEAACDTLYSEDLQDGQKLEGMTIRNPFRKEAI